MSDDPTYGEPEGNAEIREYARIMAQSFNGPPAAFEEWALAFGVENVRVMRTPHGIRGGLVIYRMGQYFGGRSVPIWGVAGVAIPPEVRGRGIARAMMREQLRENHEHGPAVSTLWPATVQLYRGLGWETAGGRYAYRVRTSDLPREKSPLTMRRAVDADRETLKRLYARRFMDANGPLDRNDAIWKRASQGIQDAPALTYIVERDGEPEGYATWVQKREGDTGYVFNLMVSDFVALTREAARRVLSTFADHRSVTDEVQIYGAPNDVLLLEMLSSQKVRVHNRLDWMLRVVRVKDALEQRGYNPAVTARAEFRLIDEELPGNHGNWILGVEGGSATVEPGGEGAAVLHVRGLSSLFSGRYTPAELRRAGLLEGDDKHDAALAAMFAGPTPWMPDFF